MFGSAGKTREKRAAATPDRPKRTRAKNGQMDAAARAAKQGAAALKASHESSAALRDIGLPPDDTPLQQWGRDQVSNDLEKFLQWLSPDVFPWPFSDDQRLSIQQMDSVTERGGLQAVADPRGTGKTQRAIRAALKAILTGRRRSVVIVAATGDSACDIIDAIKTILCYSQPLTTLFKRELHGFAQLQGDNRKAGGQLCCGVKTGISIGAGKIIFPTIPGSKCSGAQISAYGLTGHIRGKFEQTREGKVDRPDLLLVDDPQTKESANNSDQTGKRQEIIEGDCLGLAGPGKSIAAMVLCTVIAKDDLSERLLAAPKWHGRRTKTVYQFPTNMKAWDQYFDDMDEIIRLKEPDEKPEAVTNRINQIYLANREELDAGCELAWIHRIEEGLISPIQTAMHIYHRVGPGAFGAEYQNEPLVDADEATKPTFAGLAVKTIGLPRGIVPAWATKLTMAIDVQMTCLFWMIVAWGDDFTGHIVDYGAWPEQSRAYFILREVTPTLQMKSGSSQPQGAIRWGLDTITQHMLTKDFKVETGGQMRIGKAVVDARYHPDTVHEFIRRSPHGAMILPTLGEGITAGKLPMERWAKRPDETIKWHVVIKQQNANRVRRARVDTHHWKTFACERIAAAMGEKGTLTVFGDRPETHRLLTDHLSAEFCTKTTASDGRVIWEWKQSAGRDNHWLDNLSANCVAAYLEGCALNHGASGTHPDGPMRRNVTIPKHLQRRKGA